MTEPLSESIVVRLTVAQKAALVARACLDGTSVAELCRTLLDNAMTQQKPFTELAHWRAKKENMDELKSYVAILRIRGGWKIGKRS